MLRVDCYDFFKLGLHVHPLTLLADDAILNDVWISLYLGKNEVFTFFANFPLKTSIAPARVLYQAILEIVPDDFSQVRFINEATSEQRTLTFTEASSIREAAKELETVLKAELSGWNAYFVSQKGAFSTSDLINSAENMLPDKARELLSPAAMEDVRQAGRCLAFNLGTAACFHIVRATETFIWRYYETLIGKMPPMKMRNWGAYIRALSQCDQTNGKVLGWLTHIKDEYRNPVLHPDENVNPDDAQMFINACLSLMTTIANDLRRLQSENPVPVKTGPID
jgi:hypothetical protein